MMLIFILFGSASGLVFPSAPLGYSPEPDGTGLTHLELAQASQTLAVWTNAIDSNRDVFPQCSADACVQGIHLIRKRETLIPPFNTLISFTYGHKFATQTVHSHILLCVLDPVQNVVSLMGIVENPANISYNKLVYPDVCDLKEYSERANCKLRLDPLSKWGSGVFYYALSRQSPFN
uniref:Uncharacterized protein n=1 Tax=viral metagenome TaxID=1070528 RepID=A0A6C0K9G3_9ZZZZ